MPNCCECKKEINIENKELVFHDITLDVKEKIDFISTLQILLQSGIPAVESLMFMELKRSFLGLKCLRT